ncbi:hypothetical protein RF11_14783 [Thelohanellus kitauei]|uniref:Uncharacterized protein n=1 Tax=Thelohanellus kitauei TaxID=669202 RepID=A0A0C2JJF5_THEKT|nr:hypothetical protein RF11_14783 [Thelohanellus kitauei]
MPAALRHCGSGMWMGKAQTVCSDVRVSVSVTPGCIFQNKHFQTPANKKKYEAIKGLITQRGACQDAISVHYQNFASAMLRPKKIVEEFAKKLEGYLSKVLPGLDEVPKEFLTKQRIFQCLPVTVANQLRVLGELSVSELSSKADILISSGHISQVSEKEEISQSFKAASTVNILSKTDNAGLE